MSEETIHVYVVKSAADGYVMRYRNPITGRWVQPSAGTANRKDADKAAAKWETELQEGRYAPKSMATWEHFRERYDAEKLESLSRVSRDRYNCALDVFEAACNPQRLRDVTPEQLGYFQMFLRRKKRSEATIKSHLRHIKAALNWAHGQGLLRAVPHFEMPRRARGDNVMRGRALTLEEFERMLAAVEAGLFDSRFTRPKGKATTIAVWSYRLPHTNATAAWLSYGIALAALVL